MVCAVDKSIHEDKEAELSILCYKSHEMQRAEWVASWIGLAKDLNYDLRKRHELNREIKVTTIKPTGVPLTGLGAGVLNPEAIGGILGAGQADFMATFEKMMMGEAPDALSDAGDIQYFALSPELLADQIVFAIDQPWGVSIGELTVRASGDAYMI